MTDFAGINELIEEGTKKVSKDCGAIVDLALDTFVKATYKFELAIPEDDCPNLLSKPPGDLDADKKKNRLLGDALFVISIALAVIVSVRAL